MPMCAGVFMQAQAPRVAMSTRLCKTNIIAATPIAPLRLGMRKRVHTSNIVAMAEGAVPLHSGSGQVPPMLPWRDMTKEERLAGFRTVCMSNDAVRSRAGACS